MIYLLNNIKIIGQPISQNKPDFKKILLIRTDGIGDVILTLPMVDVLRYNYPDAKIDFLAGKRTAELVLDYPNINKVYTIEKDSIKAVKDIAKGGKYDLAIVVHPQFPIAMGIYLAGIKQRLGTAYRWYSFLFNLKHHQHRRDSVKHELEYNLDLLNEINCLKLNDIKPVIKVSEKEIDEVRTKLSSEGITGESFIVIHIPSLGSAKVWSDRNFIDLLNRILNDKELDFKVILTGTNSDIVQVKSITERVIPNNRIFAVFDLNLKQLAALLKLSRLFIGNSSGPIHLAAAVGTFVVGLYSPVKEQSQVRWGPYTDKKKVFVPERNDDSDDVMDDIMPEDVFNFVKNFFKNK